MQMRKLKSFDEVVVVFGGAAVLAQRTGNRTSAVWNWKMKRGRFPAKFYRSMTKELASRGFRASSKLWGQTELLKEKVPIDT